MVRICPERDAICPHGDNCPYALDRYRCRSEEEPVDPAGEPQPVAWTSDWQIERVSLWGSLGDMGPKDQFSRPVPLFTFPPDLAAENARLRAALERLRDATPYSTDTVSADGAFEYVHAVVDIALAEQKSGQ